MIHIPDPSRLVTHRLPMSSGSGRQSLPAGLLTLGSIPVLLVCIIGGGALGAAAIPWLAIPAGIAGFSTAMGLTQESIVVCGVVEAIFYGGIAFIFTGGLETHDRGTSTALAAVVAAMILGLTYVARNERLRCFKPDLAA